MIYLITAIGLTGTAKSEDLHAALRHGERWWVGLEPCPRTGIFPFYITFYQSTHLNPKSIHEFGILLKWWSTREVRSTTLSQDQKATTSVCN